MNTTTGTATDVERYLSAVRDHLADLPDGERDDLLEDLEQHLSEVAAESEEPLEARLGPPRAYAAELRASAGRALDPAVRPAVGARLRSRSAAWAESPHVTGALAFARDLRPGWWVARGYLAASVWAVLSYPYVATPVPRVSGSPTMGLLLALSLTALSVHVGRRAAASRAYRVTGTAFTVVVVFFLPLLGTGSVTAEQEADDPEVFFESGLGGAELWAADGTPITNLYPFDADGAPLTDVRLYDQAGNPVEIVVDYTPDGRSVVTSYPVDADGVPVTNAFPQRQAVRDLPGREDWGTPFGETPHVAVPPLHEETGDGGETGDEEVEGATDGAR